MLGAHKWKRNIVRPNTFALICTLSQDTTNVEKIGLYENTQKQSFSCVRIANEGTREWANTSIKIIDFVL